MKFYLTFFHKAIIYIALCTYFNTINAQVKTSKEPNWVLNQDYKTTIDIALDEVDYGYVMLLADEQVHLPKQERYYRNVKKITDNLGIQHVAEVGDIYDPKYQTITFHKIDIVRNGEVINKLDVNNFQVIRRESNSENYIYDGRLTAITNLADIRKDDIVDYSYTITGFNPIHNGNFSGAFSLNNFIYINKSNIRILSNTDLDYKLFNSDLQPTVTSENGLKVYRWFAENIQNVEIDYESPSWLIEYQNLFVSDYKTWKNVIDWGTKLYHVKDKISPQLQAKINAIKSKSIEESDRIVAALEFVQNEIRYLGLEDGIGSYKPFSPNKVFEQRFGDCKDKTLLLVTILNAMDIEAYPMLVNSVIGKSIPEILPSPKSFDHVVVKATDKTGRDLYYDPTMTNQKGSYEKIYFPNYETGLVLKEGNFELEELQNFSDNLVEVFDEFKIDQLGKGATLKVTTIYYEYEADKMRNYYKNSSLTSIKSDFKDYYANYYEHIEPITDPIIEDDSLKNIITIYENYELQDIWSEVVTDGDDISVTFTPSAIYDILIMPTEKERKKEFALYYPATKRHTINIKLPRAWNISSSDYNIYSKDFYYEFEGNYKRATNELNLMSYYKNQSSYVKPENFKQYYKDIKDLENRISYYISVPKSYAASDSNIRQKNSNSTQLASDVLKNLFLFLVLPIIVILVIILLIVLIVKNSKK